MIFDYKPIKDAVAHWNGHAVEIDWTPNASTHNNSITIGAKKYNLIQFHFHTPSEHRINNRHADAELHMVHRNPDDNALAVVAVLLHTQLNNVPFFQYLTDLNKKIIDAFTPDIMDDSQADPEAVAIPEAAESERDDKEEQDENDEEEEDAEEEEKDVEEEEADEANEVDEGNEDKDDDSADIESQEIDLDQDNLDSNQQLFATDTVISDIRENLNPIFSATDANNFDANNNEGGKCKHPHDPEDLICTGGRPTNEDAALINLKLKSVDFSPLLHVIGKFSPRWEYSGSLTTPPCSENVAWNVIHNPFPIGLKQLRALVDLQGFNAREIHENKATKALAA